MSDKNEISPDRYVFWLDNFTVLYKNDNYIRFFPTKDMTRIEQLNAITRFFIYLSLLFIIFQRPSEWLYISFIGILMCVILYMTFESDDQGKKDELLRMKRVGLKDHYDEPEINYRTYQVNDDGEIITIDIDKEYYKNVGDVEGGTKYDLEAGYYDSAGKLLCGSYNGPLTETKNPDSHIKYTLDEMRLYRDVKARRPTVDNPFMNPSVDDFNKEAVPIAASNGDVIDDDLGKEITDKFNADLYRDIEDVFNKKNSQRQFYTIAHNIPNDQEAFARWCYKYPATCKTNQERCLRYEDLRTKY